MEESIIVNAIMRDLKNDINPMKLKIIPWYDTSFHEQHRLLRKRVADPQGLVTTGFITINGVQYWALESLREYLWRLQRGVYKEHDSMDQECDEHFFRVDSKPLGTIPVETVRHIEQRLKIEICNFMGWEEQDFMNYRCTVSLNLQNDDDRIYVIF